jgi:nicotinamidase/pyrazinamidase
MPTSDRSSAVRVQLARGDALVIVDVQNDFVPGGSLAVPRGDEIVPVLNQYIAAFLAAGLPVYATRDWHPADHCSFREHGGIWPAHCIAETAGAAFVTGLRLPASAIIVSKATGRDRDAYSGFAGTDLEARLRAAGAGRLYVGGLATDYCVLNTVRDACSLGFHVVLLADAIGAVNANPGDGPKALAEMLRLGARPLVFGHLPAGS